MKLQFSRLSAAGLALVATAALGANAHAQATCGAQAAGTATCSPAGVNVTTTVQRIVHLTVTPAAASLTAPTHTDFASGGTTAITNLGLHSLTVRANVAWQVTLNGGAWTAPYTKALSDLEWTPNNGGSWTAMSAAPVSLQTGSATAGTDVSVGYRTTWTLEDDEPGAYAMPLTFTISSS